MYFGDKDERGGRDFSVERKHCTRRTRCQRLCRIERYQCGLEEEQRFSDSEKRERMLSSLRAALIHLIILSKA